jgi:hypothetical protein
MNITLTIVIARSASDEAIHLSTCRTMDCFAALAMTTENVGWAKARQRRAHHSHSATQMMVGTLRFAHPTAFAMTTTIDRI